MIEQKVFFISLLNDFVCTCFFLLLLLLRRDRNCTIGATSIALDKVKWGFFPRVHHVKKQRFGAANVDGIGIVCLRRFNLRSNFDFHRN